MKFGIFISSINVSIVAIFFWHFSSSFFIWICFNNETNQIRFQLPRCNLQKSNKTCPYQCVKSVKILLFKKKKKPYLYWSIQVNTYYILLSHLTCWCTILFLYNFYHNVCGAESALLYSWGCPIGKKQ